MAHPEEALAFAFIGPGPDVFTLASGARGADQG